MTGELDQPSARLGFGGSKMGDAGDSTGLRNRTLRMVSETYGRDLSHNWNEKGGLIMLLEGDDDFIKKAILLNAAELPNGATIVDFGCGTGGVLCECACRYPSHNYIGVDVSLAMAKETSGKLNADKSLVIVSSIEECPLPENSVDLAIAKMVLHHTSDPNVAIRKIFRSLKSGGRFLAMVPGKSYQSAIVPYRSKNDPLGRFTMKRLQAAATDAGFVMRARHTHNFKMTFANIGTYFKFMNTIGATSKLFHYNHRLARTVSLFLEKFRTVLSSGNQIVAEGEYLTIECLKA